jgi:serine phosphatase RsbU (regulator of sigma subunit)
VDTWFPPRSDSRQTRHADAALPSDSGDGPVQATAEHVARIVDGDGSFEMRPAHSDHQVPRWTMPSIRNRVSSSELALAVFVVVVVADVLTGTRIRLAGYLGLVPLLASASATPQVTLAFGAVATTTATASGIWNDRFLTSQHLLVILLVVIQSGIALYVATVRSRRETELREVRAVADVAQRALLPTVPRAMDGVGFATRYVSASQEASVGGDLYEVINTQHTIRVVIGDVKGKGLPAVRLASVVLGAFREAATTWLETAQVAAACARAVNREADSEDFVTALLIDIHANGRLSLCAAGHPPPVLLPASGPARTLRMATPNPPLGIAEQFTVTESRWEISDRLLLFTDGLVEARNETGAFFPLAANLVDVGRGSLDDALDHLTERVIAHVGGNLRDDLALVLAERRPHAEATTAGSEAAAASEGAGARPVPVPGRPEAGATPPDVALPRR